MAQVTKAPVVGIDIGSADTIVAFVGRGAVDIVQNEVSSRKTPSLVGFLENKRLLGDPALSAIKSNMNNTCRAFQTIIGRTLDDPLVQEESEWACAPIVDVNGTTGFRVNFKGEETDFSTEKVMAMYLTKLKNITEGWCGGKLSDIVLSIPAHLNDMQRQAWLDAVNISGLKCLRLMHEHAAVALTYGIYRSNDFDAEKPLNVIFVNSGHTHTTAFVCSFIRGKLTCLSESSTSKVCGRALDLVLMRYFGAIFQKKYGCDPMSNKKARFKLEEAVRKTKAVLSSNSEATISVECLMEDEDLGGKIDRAEFEALNAELRPILAACVEDAITQSGVPKEDLAFCEVSGGSARVPFIKEVISEVTKIAELSTTLNMDECVARGCALQAAMISPLFKVRDFTVVDHPKFPIAIHWSDTGAAADGEDVQMDDAEEGAAKGKSATLFGSNSSIPTLKNVSFNRKSSFQVSLEYANADKLPANTKPQIGQFDIAVAAADKAKKVRVLTELDIHGMARFQRAELLEEEEYEETSKEKREIVEEADAPVEGEAAAPAAEEAAAPPADAAADATPAEGAEKADVEMKDEKEEEKKSSKDAPKKEEKKEKKKEKKYEWVEVKKQKKRTKVTELPVTRTGVAGMAPADVQTAADAESVLQSEMQEIEETEIARNELESYVYNMRDRTSEGGQYGEFIAAADREAFHSALMKAEDWLYDNENATKVVYVEKLAEISVLGNPSLHRYKAKEARDDFVSEVKKTIAYYREQAESTDEKYAHIDAAKKQQITDECAQVEGWLNVKVTEQENTAKHLEPVWTVAQMEEKQKDIAAMADKILAEPKPAPPVEAPAEKAEDKAGETAEPAAAETPAPKPEEVDAALDVD